MIDSEIGYLQADKVECFYKILGELGIESLGTVLSNFV